MNTWIIEPRDPLIVRDGKPFGPNPGARAATLPFPMPSTTTGGVRTAAGLGADGSFDISQIGRVKQIGVRGPLLVAVGADGQIAQWLPPAPADALLLQIKPSNTKQAALHHLHPLDVTGVELGNLPRDVNAPDLLPVGLTPPVAKKPFGKAPGFWFQAKFERWLRDPMAMAGTVTAAELGVRPLLQERRTHVSLDRATQTAEEGKLFATTGLAFEQPVGDEETDHPLQTVRLALAVLTEEAPQERVAPLGGERRLMHWRGASGEWVCPQDIKDSIAANGHCRLILLTPALFDAGWRPSWLLAERYGVTATLRAAAVPRHQVVSGWDFALGKPKKTRRLAPAGSVYYLTLSGTPDQRRAWIENIWLHCVSDAGQDRLDGFGVAALGTWSGIPTPLLMTETDNDA